MALLARGSDPRNPPVAWALLARGSAPGCSGPRSSGCRGALDSRDVTEDQRTQLPPQYAPGEVEARRYDDWMARSLFAADAGAPGPAYSIVIPPPNVTGSLHMGHPLDHTLIDALIRRRRMQGYTTLWLPGMDHAGIATQNVG